MRLVLLLTLAACGPKTAPMVPAAFEAAPDPEPVTPEAPMTLDTPFTAAQIRDSMPLGTHMKFAMTSPDKPLVHMHWRVVEADAQGMVLRSAARTEEGVAVGPPHNRPHSWEDLRQHAAFPQAHTVVSDASVSVGAGDFEVRKYEVTEPESGAVSDFYFNLEMPGPPVLLVTREGEVETSRMELVLKELEAVERVTEE